MHALKMVQASPTGVHPRMDTRIRLMHNTCLLHENIPPLCKFRS